MGHMKSLFLAAGLTLVASLAQAQTYSSGTAATGPGWMTYDNTGALRVTGGGGGGGGAVTAAAGSYSSGSLVDGASVTLGSTTDAASSAGGTGSVSAKLRETTSLLNSILTSVSAPLAAPSGTPIETSVSCGTGSTTLLAASTATQFIMVKVPQGGNTVWINFAGSAAVQAAPSVDLTGGASIIWGATTYLPTAQINCIASAATSVTLMYK